MPSKQKRFDKFIDDLIALDLPKVLPRVWIGQYYPTFDPPKYGSKCAVTFPTIPQNWAKNLYKKRLYTIL